MRKRQGWSQAQLDSYLLSIGTDATTFRETIRGRLLQQRVIGIAIGSKVRISDKELEDYYKEKRTAESAQFEVEASHLVLKLNPTGSAAEKAAVRQLATELLARAQAGEDFTALVKQYSDGPGAPNGGYLGRFRRGSLNAAMEKVLFVLEPGQFGGSIETPFGIHVVRVIGRHSVEPESFEKVKGSLRQELHQKLMAKEFNRWITDLKAKAFIELKL